MIVLCLQLLTILLSVKSYAADSLTIYTYDSLASKGSFGALAAERFQKAFGEKVKLVPFGSAGEALNQIQVEGAGAQADLLFGMDNSLQGRVKNSGLFDPASSFIPFDYGFLGFVYDSDKVKNLPKKISLKEFSADSRFRKSIVIEDPRTSSIGLGFLIWSHSLFDKDQSNVFWKNFGQQLKTVSPGWSGAYGLFLKKEADFVLSYTTSPAYHIEMEKKHNIKCLIFPEGHYRQTEGIAVVKHSKRKELAKKFVDFILSPEMQREIPKTQWMYPVRENVELPASYKGLPKPKAITVNLDSIESSKTEWLDAWAMLSINPK